MPKRRRTQADADGWRVEQGSRRNAESRGAANGGQRGGGAPGGGGGGDVRGGRGTGANGNYVDAARRGVARGDRSRPGKGDAAAGGGVANGGGRPARVRDLQTWDCTQCRCLDNFGDRLTCRLCGAGAPASVLRDLRAKGRLPEVGGSIRPRREQPTGGGKELTDAAARIRKLEAELAAERKKNKEPDDGDAAMGNAEEQAGEDEGSEAAVRAAKAQVDKLTQLYCHAEEALQGRDLPEEEKMLHPSLGPLLELQKAASDELVRCVDARRNALPHSVKLARKQKKVRDKQADVTRTEGRVKDKEAEVTKAAAVLEQLQKDAAGLAQTLERQQASLEELTADYDLLVDEERAARDGLPGPAPASAAPAAGAPAAGPAPVAAPPSPLRQRHANADARGRAARTAGISEESFETAWKWLLTCKLVDAAPEDSVEVVEVQPGVEEPQDDPMAAAAALQLQSAGLPRNPAFVRPAAKAGPALPPPGCEGASASGAAEGSRSGSRSPRRKKQDKKDAEGTGN